MSSADRAPTFEQALAPVGWRVFLTEYWNKSFLRIPGHAGKFASLLTWRELNAILERHRLTERRLSVYQDGKRLESHRYSMQEENRVGVDVAGLMRCLGQGATLILNSVDEMAPEARSFAESLDALLDSGTETRVNLYASWRTQHGFDLHWDHQDVTIVQVAGRKQWTVYQPTRPYPLRSIKPAPPAPTGDPVWEGTLEDGDLLYLPRGWWHVAHSLDEPSLHLTVTTVPARGNQLIEWLAQQLAQHPDVRRDVPLWTSDDEQQAYLSRLLTIVTNALSEPVLDRFRSARDASIPARPRLRLPDMPPPVQVQLTMDTMVALTCARRLAVDVPVDTTQASFRVLGHRWECSPDVLPALEWLRVTPCPVRQLCTRLSSRSAVAQLMIVLGALALKGVVSVTPGSDG